MPGLGSHLRLASRLEFVFLYDALIGFVVTLDAILKLALPLGKLRENLVRARTALPKAMTC